MAESSDYEYEERAAIREFDSGLSREKAEALAAAEVRERSAPQRKLDPRQQLAELIADRDRIGKLMRAEENSEQKNELMKKWLNLAHEIIELKKEIEDGNDRRLSG